MPPNPWKLLKTADLTPEQKRTLARKLRQRQLQLKQALNNLEAAMEALSSALDQDGHSKYARKIKRKK
jgi:hypothetical protein